MSLRFYKMRKNGGFIWHWVCFDKPRIGEALCGAECSKRQRKSYWTRSLVTELSGKFCQKCESKRLMNQGHVFIGETK